MFKVSVQGHHVISKYKVIKITKNNIVQPVILRFCHICLYSGALLCKNRAVHHHGSHADNLQNPIVIWVRYQIVTIINIINGWMDTVVV